jgi:trehalose 6-phosphate phosphatase
VDANLIDEAVDVAARVLRQRPSALISDVDGTLSPIVASPEEAVVLPACRRALKDLASHLDLVAVVSGRTAADARRMVGLDELLYIGNHGLERWDNAHGYRNDAAAFEGEMKGLRAKLDERTRQIPGVRTEDKGTILSLHYRGAPRPDETRRRILALLDETLPPRGFVVAEGKMVVEVRPSLALDKGTVIEGLVEEHGLRGVVFLGDDLTDVDAMSALRQLREAGAATLGVGVAGDEVSSRLIGESDMLLPDPNAVGVFLERLAQALSE